VNRRRFIGTLIGGVTASAAVRTFPFRVFSFPAEIKLAGTCWYNVDSFMIPGHSNVEALLAAEIRREFGEWPNIHSYGSYAKPPRSLELEAWKVFYEGESRVIDVSQSPYLDDFTRNVLS